MNIQLEASKKIFYATGLLVITGGILSLFYYAYLMELHVDEAGWWFNYTNKSFQHRFIFNHLNPNHTLSIYLAKISLSIFGNTGIGLRFPVIIFAILSLAVLFLFVRKVTGSNITAFLAAALLFLNPFFLHYSHELRGYPVYFFFVTCCYLCLMRLLESGNKLSTWVVLFLLFIACYVANLAAPIFFTIFLATVWIFVIFKNYLPVGDYFSGLDKIHTRSLITYSIIAASFFAFVMFYLDKAVMPNLFAVQISKANYLAIPDLFSTFLGYRYLDDARSELYSYPTIIWLLSLLCFLYGWWSFMKTKAWQASFFLLMFVLNSLFYVSLQTWMPLRSSIYLLPFIILFQAFGLKALVEMAVSRFFQSRYRTRYYYLTLAGILVCYFSFFSIGKYRNFEPESGNPFELARSYLKGSVGPNDLIISSLYDTKGGFYLGDIILKNNLNVYKNGQIDNIYYVSPKTGETKIELDMVWPSIKKIKALALDKFELLISFENKGVRPSKVHIFKRKVGISSFTYLDKNNLMVPQYFGTHEKDCKVHSDLKGIRATCDDNSAFMCARSMLDFPNIAINDVQLVLFHHINDKGTKIESFASMKSLNKAKLTEKARKKNLRLDPFPTVYKINQLVNNIQDLDIYREDVDLIDVSIQKMGDGKNTLFCMQGGLFKGNTLIKGVRVFNLKQ